MRTGSKIVTAAALSLLVGAAPALAEPPVQDGAVVTINTLGTTPDYPMLTRGRVVFVNARRFVVTREPLPTAKVAEAPPEPQATVDDRPTPPQVGAVWVAAHWIYGPTGFSWVAGRYDAPRVGHVFVPPRWASLEGQFFFFSGFFVPYGVYVQSHFNRYYFSGVPKTRSRANQGPYWPIGAPTRANSSLTSASARDPYWPIGVRR
ncbi:MAG: hypothetical protein DRH23_16390 [Deltaproteobacteria bacterium]|nr:MAG: hypothetical protein DRH23_16390 [Deltaproteobacteria bacterium]